MDRIPTWLVDKQLSDEDLKTLGKVPLPIRALRDVPIHDLPDEFLSLRVAGDCVLNMCLYGDAERDLQTALRVIAQMRVELEDAEREIMAAREKLVSNGV